MRAKRTLLSALMVLGPILLVTDGPARGAEGTPCNAEFDLTLAPGLSNSGSSGTFTSGGETGTMDCKGKVNGKDATGPGTWGAEGKYGTKDPDSCASGGEGTVTQSFTVPTSGGSEHGTNEATFTFGGLQGGLFSGQFDGPKMSGTFQVRPTQGNCVSEPVTKVHVSLKGTLKG